MKNEGVENMKEQMQEPENILEMVPEQQPQHMSVKDVLLQDVLIINSMSYTHQEAKKFMPVFEKIAEDLTACIVAIEKEEEKHQGGEKHAEADPE